MVNVLPLPYQTFFKLFDTKISPILLYGSEMRILDQMETTERVQLLACKPYMNAPFNSVNNVILGEKGRYMYIEASKKCIK